MEEKKKDRRGRPKIEGQRKQVAFYVSLDVHSHLMELCRLSNLRPSQYFISTIEADYDRLQGNPKTKKILQQLNELETTLKNITCGVPDEQIDTK